MNKRLWILVVMATVLVWLVACSSATPEPTAEPTEIGMPNPASVYCEEQGGKLELRQDDSGGQVGICVFPDGSECEEWAYSRGECQPGDSLAPSETDSTPGANMPNPASAYCEQQGGRVEMRTSDAGVYGVCIFDDGSECDEWAYFRGECKPGDVMEVPTPQAAGGGWQVYRNAELGYSFEYPADAEIVINDDPLKSISIVGPLVDNEQWPQITISHPTDRDDYRPPDGTDLEQWLTDHNLMGDDDRMPDVQIAGTTGIHLRHERSPQSYAFDRYFFARVGQLYQVVIGHAGDKEDWEVYDHFLRSIQFDG